MSKRNLIRNMTILLGVAVSATSCSEETVDNNNNNNNTDQKGQYVIAYRPKRSICNSCIGHSIRKYH